MLQFHIFRLHKLYHTSPILKWRELPVSCFAVNKTQLPKTTMNHLNSHWILNKAVQNSPLFASANIIMQESSQGAHLRTQQNETNPAHDPDLLPTVPQTIQVQWQHRKPDGGYSMHVGRRTIKIIPRRNTCCCYCCFWTCFWWLMGVGQRLERAPAENCSNNRNM